MQTPSAAGSTAKLSRQSHDLELDELDIAHSQSRISRDIYDMDPLRRSEDDEREEMGHTSAEQRQISHNKRVAAQLDERISSSAGTSSKELDSSTVKASMVKNILINTLFISLWYCFSISISVYNKWMFSKDNLDFPFPLFTTSMHMIMQFGLASAVLYFFPQFRPKPAADSLGEYSAINNEDETQVERPSKQPLMTWWFYLTRVGPCGTATALDVGLGNFSLRFISLTFYTMCKSSVLGFVLLFAFIFRLETPTWRLCLIILVMTAGVVMMVTGETAFSAPGFILVMSASLCSGFRWSLTQILLLRNPATSNPFSSIFFLTPIMFLALFILAIPIEGISNVIAGVHNLAQQKGALLGTLILLFPGTLAFLMVSSEFALLKRTSVVTLSVCGIFKEVMTISAAGAVFGDALSPINISGLVVTIISIAAYNYLKISGMRREARQEVAKELDDNEDEQQMPSRMATGDREDVYSIGSSSHEEHGGIPGKPRRSTDSR